MDADLTYCLDEIIEILCAGSSGRSDARFEEVRRHLERRWLAWARTDDLVEDACQATWEKMLLGGFEKLAQMHAQGKFENTRMLEGYLFLIFRNQWIDMLRARKRDAGTSILDLAERLPSTERSPEAAAELRKIVEKVVAFLRTLDPTDRQIFYWRFVEGLSDREIADRLGVSRAAVAAKLKRWRKKLRELLGEFWNDRSGGGDDESR